MRSRYLYFSGSLVNLALRKPATQINTYAGGIAVRAVDGNPNGHWGGRSCTHTYQGTGSMWWRVDLQQASTVHKVTLITNEIML